MKKTLAGIALLLGAATLALGGCCNDVTASTCFSWSRSTACPSRDVAASKLGVGVDRVTSDGTFWPAHDYRIDGRQIHEPSTCCYDVVSTVCTEELH